MSTNELIPVIGTLGGAIIGFATSFVTSWWIAKKTESREFKNRTRQTLEETYKTLIIIRSEYQQNIGMCINKIHNNVSINPIQHTGTPPIIKAEMLIKLYGKDLRDLWGEFAKRKDDFGRMYANILTTNYQSKELKEKQKITEDILVGFEKMDHFLKKIENKIIEIIEP